MDTIRITRPLETDDQSWTTAVTHLIVDVPNPGENPHCPLYRLGQSFQLLIGQ